MNYHSPCSVGFQPLHRPVASGIPVKQNLALTPSQIGELTANGMAVSSYNNLVYDDGVPNPPSRTLDTMRGIDVAEIWETSKSSERKLRSFVKKNSQTDTSN